MNNKKGFELSATVIVLLIITIIIFTSSLFFVKKFFTEAEELKTEIERSTQEQIESLLRSGNVVAIPLNKKTIKRGNDEIFGLGIRNVGADKKFWVSTSFYKAFGIDGKTPIPANKWYIDENWLLYFEGPYNLRSNELKLVPVSIKVGNAADYNVPTQAGTYVFNVCVFTGDSYMDCDLEQFTQSGAGFPEELYSQKAYQILVEVPA